MKLWRDDTNYGRANAQQKNSFKPSMEDEVIQVYMIWGLKKQDRSRCDPHSMDPVCRGRTVWDEGFDLNPAPAQVALRVSIVIILLGGICNVCNMSII